MYNLVKVINRLALFLIAVMMVCGGFWLGHEVFAQSGERVVMRARAEIAGNGISGEATLSEVERGTDRFVRVQLKLKGDPAKLTPGLHGIHFHEKAVCEGDFKSAGGHFDPGPASNPDPDVNHPFHLGDLPNIRIGSNGTGTLDAVTTRVTLSDGPLSLMDSDGTALIIHAREDQRKSGPTGSGVSGGPRLACGIIKKL